MRPASDLLASFRALALVAPQAQLGRNFAVLAPHPDDESLGCGGVIAEACAAGYAPPVMILTDGAGSHPGSAAYGRARLAAVRAREAEEAVAALGLPMARLHLLGEPDGDAPRDAAGIARVAGRIAAVAQGCDTLLTSWRHDPHPDHASAQMIARLAASMMGARLLEYPVWGWFLPGDTALPDAAWRGWRLDVARQLPAKRAAIAAHRSQHGAVITDDPQGFILPPCMLALFDQGWETFVEADG